MNIPEEPPTIITQRAAGIDHTYKLIGERPHLNRHGNLTRVLTWRGKCCICGIPFVCFTPLKGSRYMVRTCQL